ncbi:MAG TPA: glycosyltransferase family 1 protein [Thermoplasmatales archaeon]|nr:glycosyltransferase family 1 protein [Thermoplasmatales archaeon]
MESIRVNFIVEDMGAFKYLGCATVAREIYNTLSDEIDVDWNGKGSAYDVFHFHTFGPYALYRLKTSKGINILTAHSLPSINVGNIVGSRRFWDVIYKWIYNKFDYIIAVSGTSEKELTSIGVEKPSSVIYNGINLDKFVFSEEKRKRFRERYGLEDRFVVLNVGQKTPRKGVYDFVEVAKRIEDATFVWVGGTPYRILSKDASKIKKIENTAPSNVIFTGFLPDIIEGYSGADVLFAPTYGETFGLTQMEAMACNLPVVTRDLEVFREIYGEKILLGRTVEDFAKLIRDLMEDESLRKKYSGYRKYVEERFDIKKIGRDHINLYRHLLDERASQ